MLGHIAQEWRHEDSRRAWTEADPDVSAVTMLKQLGTSNQLGCFPDNIARPDNDIVTKRCQFVALSDAIEKPSAQLFFQGLDAATQCRLSNVKAQRRSAERSGLRYRKQVLELLYIHCPYYSIHAW
jgi:hypothetical protein